ncbi:hypothetical protein A2U01_0102552 [Trifolium medium]|uniref:Uncharacterized protein n=1 Tax=Trifolium medium TaxID=97028 RepID=A0A392V215_9FABA|nr:hypothetical protein [Trifolium medium]
MARDHQPGREDETRLERFMKHKPPTFTGGYNPEGAVNWLEEVEIFFRSYGMFRGKQSYFGNLCVA